MSKLIQEFKEFAVKGNAVDMAVGVIIGGAFVCLSCVFILIPFLLLYRLCNLGLLDCIELPMCAKRVIFYNN